MGRMAAELVRQGDSVELLTAQSNRNWPTNQEWHGLHVRRLPQPSGRFWGTACFLWALYVWLQRNRAQIDLVYVSMLKHEAWTALRALRHSPVPVVLRAEGGGNSGDIAWQTRHWTGPWVRRACGQAIAFVVPTPHLQQELTTAGYPQERIHVIPNGVPLLPARTKGTQARARQHLAAAASVLEPHLDCPWIVYAGRLVRSKGLLDLVPAWVHVDQRHPQARLLLVGDGEDRRDLERCVRDRGLSEVILFPGPFSDTSELMAAADLFVLPSYTEGLSLAVLEAMSAEVGILASDIPGMRDVVVPGAGRCLPPHDARAWAEAICDALDQPNRTRAWGTAARQHVRDHYQLSHVVSSHRQLFHSLLD